MKVLLLSDASNPHTIKWASGLKSVGTDVAVWSINKLQTEFYKENNIEVYGPGMSGNLFKERAGSLKKLIYLTALSNLKKTVDEIKPDIVHAHFATSYGLLGALLNFHPYILSVWGSDVYIFPIKSILHRKLLKFNLSKADKILSTSEAMMRVTRIYTDKKIEVTPFGINLQQFKFIDKRPTDKVKIGIFKGLDTRYGHNVLFKAFVKVLEKFPNRDIILQVSGSGKEDQNYKALATSLGIAENVAFTGLIDYSRISEARSEIYMEVYPSRYDSFGVSVLEAQACGIPVVVSDRGGLPEVVANGKTGFIVPVDDVDALANAMIKLIDDPVLAKSMGKAGRKFVEDYYDFKNNLTSMVKIYESVL